MVFYRKYRPQTIADLDSAHLRQTLTAILGNKNIPHAFLFTGPKGLGKTTTARIIAKVVNCQKKEEGIEPCNVCDQCLSITNGTNMDVLEIDGASNRGIDEIRDLREKVKLAPFSAKRKVYIIDEVHMLTTEAFNALLKTIEEPPSHVIFVFCTTEPQKIPATIVSRCFHIALHLATAEELVRSLKRITTGEKIDITEDALVTVAQLAEGGFRDGAKILEEIALLANGEQITKEFIEAAYKTGNIQTIVLTLFSLISQKNAKKALLFLEETVQKGTQVGYVIEESFRLIHSLLLEKSGVSQTRSPLSTTFSLSDLRTLTALFQQAYKDMKFAVVPSLPLEMVIVAWCKQDGEISSDAKPTIAALLKKAKELKVKQILDPKSSNVEKTKKETATQQHDITTTAGLMENLIYKVKPYNHSVAGVLRGCRIKSYDKDNVIIETAYKFHKEKLLEKKTFEVLEKVIKEMTGNLPKITIELKN